MLLNQGELDSEKRSSMAVLNTNRITKELRALSSAPPGQTRRVSPSPWSPLFFLGCSLFANFSLAELWSVNINGWYLPIGTSNLDHPFSALKNNSMCMAPGRHTSSCRLKPRAPAWLVKPRLVRHDSPHSEEPPPHLCLFALLLVPPAPFWEASSLGSLPPPKCFTEHIYVTLETFLLIFRHWVRKLFNLSMFPPPLFSVIDTSCLVAEAIVFGS